jgi:hypothetical protein
LIGHDVQSCGHVEQLSVPLHTPSPHDGADCVPQLLGPLFAP